MEWRKYVASEVAERWPVRPILKQRASSNGLRPGDVDSSNELATGFEIGDFQALVLFVVNFLGEDAYGMKIRDEVQHIANRPVHMPQVYAALSRLELTGALASEANQGKSAGHRGRTRRFYKLTARGLQLLSDVVRASHGAGPKEPNSDAERKKATTA